MNVNRFIGGLKLGGARPTHFEVVLTNPQNPISDINTPLLIKAAQIPSSTMGVINAPYFGRQIKLAGDRTYEDWTVTVINDEDFLIRNALEEWSHAINSPQGNRRGFDSASPLQYRTNAQVTQFSKTGVPIRTYNFNNIWPSQIAPIDLSWETVDTLEEFTVTFAFDYWTVEGATGDAGTNSSLI